MSHYDEVEIQTPSIMIESGSQRSVFVRLPNTGWDTPPQAKLSLVGLETVDEERSQADNGAGNSMRPGPRSFVATSHIPDVCMNLSIGWLCASILQPGQWEQPSGHAGEVDRRPGAGLHSCGEER